MTSPASSIEEIRAVIEDKIAKGNALTLHEQTIRDLIRGRRPCDLPDDVVDRLMRQTDGPLKGGGGSHWSGRHMSQAEGAAPATMNDAILEQS